MTAALSAGDTERMQDNRTNSLNRRPWRALATSLSRVLLPLIYVCAFALPPLLVGGVGVARALLGSQTTAPPSLVSLPDRPTYDPEKPIAVVVAGNHATEISDLLGPYEALATSGKYNVCVAAPERIASPFFPGSLSVVPHYSFSEYDAAFGGAVDLLVVPYIPNASTSDPAVLQWIREKAASGTTVLSICAGAQVAADAGVLSGRSATTHHDTLPVVEQSHPEVQWVHGKRWVDSGQFI
jgi:putative intracellular protease/amidase